MHVGLPPERPARSRRKAGGLVDDDRSESLPDYRFGTAHHLIDDAGGAHQSLGLTEAGMVLYPWCANYGGGRGGGS
jgi:hypothetical protein